MDVGHVCLCAAYVTLKGPYIEKKSLGASQEMDMILISHTEQQEGCLHTTLLVSTRALTIKWLENYPMSQG